METNLLKQLKNDVNTISIRVKNLPTADYIQAKLRDVTYELDRLERLSKSRELSLLAKHNGGHISDSYYTENGHYDRS